MKIPTYRLKQIPKGFDNYGYEISEFNENELKDIYSLLPDAVFYWYARGSYEGSGELLILKDKKWYLHYCGHCSCYGPIDRLYLDNPIADSLGDVKLKCSKDEFKNVECLINLAKKEGYK